jgi:hypothetical protein
MRGRKDKPQFHVTVPVNEVLKVRSSAPRPYERFIGLLDGESITFYMETEFMTLDCPFCGKAVSKPKAKWSKCECGVKYRIEHTSEIEGKGMQVVREVANYDSSVGKVVIDLPSDAAERHPKSGLRWVRFYKES